MADSNQGDRAPKDQLQAPRTGDVMAKVHRRPESEQSRTPAPRPSSQVRGTTSRTERLDGIASPRRRPDGTSNRSKRRELQDRNMKHKQRRLHLDVPANGHVTVKQPQRAGIMPRLGSSIATSRPVLDQAGAAEQRRVSATGRFGGGIKTLRPPRSAPAIRENHYGA